MKVGDTVTVGRGEHKGLTGRVIKVLKDTYRIKSTIDTEDDYDADVTFYMGELLDVDKFDIDHPKDDLKVLENQIREKSVELAGLILKKKVLLDPDGAMKKVERILETMDV